MAWNPSPEVAVARDAAAKLGTLAGTTVNRIVMTYTTTDGRIGSTTYGMDVRHCTQAKALGDDLYAAAMKHIEG